MLKKYLVIIQVNVNILVNDKSLCKGPFKLSIRLPRGQKRFLSVYVSTVSHNICKLGFRKVLL